VVSSARLDLSSVFFYSFVAPMHPLETYLISKLYKQLSGNTDDSSVRPNTDSTKELLRISEAQIAARTPIRFRGHSFFPDLFKRKGWCGCRYKDDEIIQLKAF
jgi:hypothetical protein